MNINDLKIGHVVTLKCYGYSYRVKFEKLDRGEEDNFIFGAFRSWNTNTSSYNEEVGSGCFTNPTNIKMAKRQKL